MRPYIHASLEIQTGIQSRLDGEAQCDAEGD